MTDSEIDNVVELPMRAPSSATTEDRFKNTDLGNAQRLVARYGRNIRYLPEMKRWIVWNGNSWKFDNDGEVERLAKERVRSMFKSAYDIEDNDQRNKRVKWALQSQGQGHLRAMVQLAQTEPGIPIAVQRLDKDPMLLGVQNGVVNLRTGEHLKPRHDYFITKVTPVEYSPEAQCPKFEAALKRICNGDEALMAFHQRRAGYCATGLTREQVISIDYGEGANGKTLLVRCLQTALGDYAMTTPPDTLMRRRNSGGPSPDLARLRGARLVVATEPNQNCELAEEVVKRITGQDKIACRPLYADYFEFVPQFKVILATNHRPNIRGDDHAIWRRIHLVPFPVTIPEDEQDKELLDYLLTQELPGILNWIIKGALAYREQGLNPPECVRVATARYKSDMDLLGDWIAECCIEEPNAEGQMKELYPCYAKWADDSRHRSWSKKTLGQRLERRGFVRGRNRYGAVYRGLRLKEARHADHKKRDAADIMNQKTTRAGDTGDGCDT